MRDIRKTCDLPGRKLALCSFLPHPLTDEKTKPAIKTCPHCAEDIKAEAKKCKHCGEFLDGAERPHAAHPVPAQAWNPGVAAVLSFLIPGAGQIYKGDIGIGLGLLLCTVIGYMFFILPGICFHIYAVYSAYNAPAPKPKGHSSSR